MAVGRADEKSSVDIPVHLELAQILKSLKLTTKKMLCCLLTHEHHGSIHSLAIDESTKPLSPLLVSLPQHHLTRDIHVSTQELWNLTAVNSVTLLCTLGIWEEGALKLLPRSLSLGQERWLRR